MGLTSDEREALGRYRKERDKGKAGGGDVTILRGNAAERFLRSIGLGGQDDDPDEEEDDPDEEEDDPDPDASKSKGKHRAAAKGDADAKPRAGHPWFRE